MLGEGSVQIKGDEADLFRVNCHRLNLLFGLKKSVVSTIMTVPISERWEQPRSAQSGAVFNIFQRKKFALTYPVTPDLGE